MRKPRIALAITSGAATPTQQNYLRAIETAGGEGGFVSPDDVEATTYDGLLIMGGPDIDPSHYSQQNTGCEQLLGDDRYRALTKLFQSSLHRDIPVLGICMGMQFINIQFPGGTLIQDMPRAHRNGSLDKEEVVRAVQESLAGRILGGDTHNVKCHHHQAIDKVGDGLRVSAQAEDGTIEAIEHPDYAFLLGVQWHPERTPTDESKRLFKEFVTAASIYMERALR